MLVLELSGVVDGVPPLIDRPLIFRERSADWRSRREITKAQSHRRREQMHADARGSEE